MKVLYFLFDKIDSDRYLKIVSENLFKIFFISLFAFFNFKIEIINNYNKIFNMER